MPAQSRSRCFWGAALGVLVLAGGCSGDADPGGSPNSVPVGSLEERAQRLAAAPELLVATGDLDDDAISELVLFAVPDGIAPSSSGAGELGQALGPQVADADNSVVLTHDISGNLVIADDNREFTFSSARLAGSISRSALAEDSRRFLGRLARGLLACDLADFVGELIGSIVRDGALTHADSVEELLDTVFGKLCDVARPALTADEDFRKCLGFGQTVMGCLLIQLPRRLDACCPRETYGCAWLHRTPHNYAVLDEKASTECSGPAASILCDGKHPSGCCTSGFLFRSVFPVDIRNQAPYPVEPDSGPVPDPSVAVLLDGSLFTVLPEMEAALALLGPQGAGGDLPHEWAGHDAQSHQDHCRIR